MSSSTMNGGEFLNLKTSESTFFLMIFFQFILEKFGESLVHHKLVSGDHDDVGETLEVCVHGDESAFNLEIKIYSKSGRENVHPLIP